MLQPGEVDITSVALLQSAKSWELNYAELKDCYQYLGKSFSTLSDSDKAAVVNMCAVDTNTCVQYYMSKGQTQAQAVATYVNNRGTGIGNMMQVCSNNINDNQLIIILLTYMSQQQAELFLQSTFQLLFNYMQFAVYGKKYGNSIDGLLDYIEDYGDFAGKGLSTYMLNPWLNLSDLVAALVALLTNNRSNLG